MSLDATWYARRHGRSAGHLEVRGRMDADSVLEVLDAAEARSIRVWVDGGWGVDALLGEQTRSHTDLDLIGSEDDGEALRGVLRALGFRDRPGGSPTNFVVGDDRGREVDVHLVRFDSRGYGSFALPDGGRWPFPAAAFAARGRIGSREVRCLSADAQVQCHGQGYEPSDDDLRDMQRLRERFGVVLPLALSRLPDGGRVLDAGDGATPLAIRAAPSPREPAVLLAATLVLLVGSGIRPFERGTWWLEVAPVLIGLPLLVATFARFRLSPLLYRLLFLHAAILIVGGHYTYARVPVGFWAQDLLDLSRNHYDRLGHLAQGFVPAILARELLLRRSPLRRGRWLFFLVTCVCLAFSALYEMIEWWAALVGGDSAESFLGTQGDVWDTQWDMFLALLGALAAQALLGRVHDRSMERVSGSVA